MNEPSSSSFDSDKLDENIMYKSEAELMAVSEIAIKDTPHRTCLKRSIRQLSKEKVIKNKKLKSLQQTIRQKNKKIANMQTIINDIKNQNLVDEETSVSLLESFEKLMNMSEISLIQYYHIHARLANGIVI